MFDILNIYAGFYKLLNFKFNDSNYVNFYMPRSVDKLQWIIKIFLTFFGFGWLILSRDYNGV